MVFDKGEEVDELEIKVDFMFQDGGLLGARLFKYKGSRQFSSHHVINLKLIN